MTNEDAISRDAALDAFNGAETMGDVFYAIQKLPPVTPKQKTRYWISHEIDGGKSRIGEIGDCIAMVIDEPTITPIQRTGHWVKISECPSFTHRWECSSCGCCHRALYDFCPSCGAKMENKND